MNIHPDSRALLAFAVIIMLGLSVAGLFFIDIPPTNRDLIIAIVSGVFGASAKDVVGWYFGSSKGSSEKDATIAKLAETPAP
jgi:hypothetical protein